MKRIKVMRGIPGSGKSTYADELAKDEPTIIVSADDFFMSYGIYKFDPSKLGDAHRECMYNFLQRVNEEFPFIIVDNTNINLEDIAPYVAVGEAMDYEVEIIEISIPSEIAIERGIHAVPKNRVLDMHNRLTRTSIPSRWKRTIISYKK